VTVQSVLSDAFIWATILLIVVGVIAVVSIAIVWARGRPDGRLSPAARATVLRIVRIAVVVYVAAFIAGAIVGAFQ
jgi:hypothetical protein